jgi:hypothetical protein
MTLEGQWPLNVPPFTTLQEVREYVSGNRIQCLCCGRWFKRLQRLHLQLHGMTADDYRQRFGIPWNTSLTSAPSRGLSSSKMTPERVARFKECKKVPWFERSNRRPRVPAVRNQWAKDSETGRYFSRDRVTTGCATCGTPLETTTLCTVQPIYCDGCASRAALWHRRQKKGKQQQEEAKSLD